MKAHTSNFKEQIKTMGRELDSKITYTLNGVNVELGKEQLNSITPTYQGTLLKSVMKELDIDSNVYIPEKTILNYQFGVKVNGEYEYINFGNYVVYKAEKQEDTNSYKLICYDKMLYSMIDYEKMDITYPITIRDYIKAICDKLGITFANANDIFANYDKQIQNELYLDSENNSLGYTFRDVLDELSQVTASCICINENDELEIRYINDTNDTIDEEFLKDVNVNFGEKYGAINTIVLSRSADSDNIYYPETLPENPFEFKISDNQIMNFNDRVDYLPDIYNKLNGLEFYLNDYSSTGICYYELLDRYNVQIGDNTYSCVMLNDEINITQGLEENIYTEMPEETKTDYTKADKTDRKINQTYIIANKQSQEIEALTKKIIQVSNTISGIGKIQLDNAYEGMLHYLSIKGNISLLYPSSQEALYGYGLTPSETLTPGNALTPSTFVPKDNKILYPSNDLYIKSSNLIIDDKEYKLDINFLNYMNNDDCDEFIYEEGKCKIIRRLGVDENGELYKLENEIVEFRNDIILEVKSNSSIKLKSFDNAILSSTYLLQNEFTSNFVTEVDAIARINLSPGTAVIEATKLAQITADKINLEGYTTINKGFNIDEDGNMYCNNATIRGSAIVNGKNFSVNEEGNMICKDATITGGNITLYTEKQNTAKITVGQTDASLYTEITPVGYQCNAKGILSASYYWNGVFLNSAISNTKSIFNDGGISFRNGDTLMAYMNSDGIVGAYTYNNLSLESKKKNFEKFNNALSIINDIDLYKYNYKHEADGSKKHIGFVIGENYNYSSEITSLNDKGEEIGADLYAMASLCLQAIKEQQTLIEELKREIKQLKERESDN